MRPVSEAASRIAGHSFSRKYIAIGRIVKHWTEIVGEDLAKKAQPAKLHYRKEQKRGKASVTLEIACASADATLMHYQKDLILERINQIFGERWITGIRFVPVTANQPPAFRKKIPKPLTMSEKNTLSGIVNPVSDPEIREKLEGLGQAILMEEKS